MTMVQVSAGRGPQEVQTFAQDLAGFMEAHLGAVRVAEGRGFVQLNVEACLEGWIGTHELVDASRGRGGRKRWFVGVSRLVLVDVADFDERQVRVRTDRAGGPGGQHVNTTASAVRATYAPLGLSVRVSSERSQHQNRRKALVWLLEEHGRLRLEASRAMVQAGWAGHDRVVRGEAVRSWRRGRGGLVLEVLGYF